MAVLIFITFTVLHTFTYNTLATVISLDPSRERFQVPDTSSVKNQAGLRANRLAPTRKKVTVLAPLDQVNQPASGRDSELIDSVFVPNVFSYEVVQQPENKPYYVSSAKDLVTEFGLAKQYNNVGLLAHNNLAGRLFKNLQLGQEIHIVYKDGHTEPYIVSAIYRFQALDPDNTESQFIDLSTQKTLSAIELFERMYTGGPHLTFQTCINAEGDASWGRLFVIATPVNDAE